MLQQRQKTRSNASAKSPLSFLSLCLVLVLFACAAGTLFACGNNEELEPTEPSYESPYNFDNLVQENGRFFYYENGELASRFGIDVSEHQHHIDWEAVAADGVEFAYVRLGNRGATEGHLYLDKYYEANMIGSTHYEIPNGVYFFSQALTPSEAREEAEFVLEHLEGWKLEYPVVYDHEHVNVTGARANHLSGEEISACAEAFFEVIEAAGYETSIYGNKKDLTRLDEPLLSTRLVWFAEYGVPFPTLGHDLHIWQYTGSGTVAGIDTLVDLNIHFLSLEY